MNCGDGMPTGAGGCYRRHPVGVETQTLACLLATSFGGRQNRARKSGKDQSVVGRYSAVLAADAYGFGDLAGYPRWF